MMEYRRHKRRGTDSSFVALSLLDMGRPGGVGGYGDPSSLILVQNHHTLLYKSTAVFMAVGVGHDNDSDESYRKVCWRFPRLH